MGSINADVFFIIFLLPFSDTINFAGPGWSTKTDKAQATQPMQRGFRSFRLKVRFVFKACGNFLVMS